MTIAIYRVTCCPFDAYEELVGRRRVLDLLGEPAGVEDVELIIRRQRDVAEPAIFD